MMKPLSQKSNWAVNSLTSDWILQDNLFIPLIADQYYWSMLFEIRYKLFVTDLYGVLFTYWLICSDLYTGFFLSHRKPFL